MSFFNLTPDEINAQQWPADPTHHCHVCRVTTGLHWFKGTSVPCCSKQECADALHHQYTLAYIGYPHGGME